MNSPKIAVITLCHPKHRGNMARRAESISTHFKTIHGYDHFIFEDRGFKKAFKDEISSLIPTTKFINLWENPTLRLAESCTPGKLIGYKGMCLFYATEFLNYLEEYDYVIRMDADSFLKSDLDIDAFITSGAVHGYIRDKTDNHGATRKTLPAAIKKYVNDNKVNILCNENDINCKNFYSNFGIMKTAFWRSTNVSKFLDFIYKAGGIATHRWGDSTIQGNALRMFCEPDKIIKLNFKYVHGSHRWRNF
jgi:hypothetical protein